MEDRPATCLHLQGEVDHHQGICRLCAGHRGEDHRATFRRAADPLCAITRRTAREVNRHVTFRHTEEEVLRPEDIPETCHRGDRAAHPETCHRGDHVVPRHHREEIPMAGRRHLATQEGRSSLLKL